VAQDDCEHRTLFSRGTPQNQPARFTPHPMRDVILHLNYLHVLVVALAGFLIGWLWFGVLFGRVWMAEMKISREAADAVKAQGMAKFMLGGFALTLLGTFGLAALVAAHHVPNWKHGAAYGMFIGACVAAARVVNGGIWESKSLKLHAINAAHELALFTVQGAILGAWQ
jgi:hypothetical protein